jgi:hypothetical protein
MQDTYGSAVLISSQSSIPGNISYSLVLGGSIVLEEKQEDNYLGMTASNLKVYYDNPTINIFRKSNDLRTWTLGDTYDPVHYIYTD